MIQQMKMIFRKFIIMQCIQDVRKNILIKDLLIYIMEAWEVPIGRVF